MLNFNIAIMYYLKSISKDGVELNLESYCSMAIYQAIDILRAQGETCVMSVRGIGYVKDFSDDYRLDIL